MNGERDHVSSAGQQSSSQDFGDTAEASEFYFTQGWTDGLPVVPPTEESVRAMLDSVGREAGEEIDRRVREIVPQVVELLLDKSLATKEALLSGGSGG